MKDRLTLQGQKYISGKLIQLMLDIDYKTEKKWSDTGVLPTPILLGKRRYFDLEAVETHILNNLEK
jgi:hypothetical protein